jgi:hypothetical protein
VNQASSKQYSHQLMDVSNSQISTWQVIKPPQDRLPTLKGPCPACRHQWEFRVPDVVVQGGASAAADVAQPPKLTRLIDCNCHYDHQNPGGIQAGCGACWLVTLILEEDGTYQLSSERSPGLLAAAEALSQALATQNARIQGAAEKWLGAVAAIYGLFSLTGIATAKDALLGLSTLSKSAVATVLAIGIAAASAALLFGYQAAYGWPRAVRVDDDSYLRTWYQEYRDHAILAALQLRRAVYLAFCTLAAVTLVMLLIWFLPRR